MKFDEFLTFIGAIEKEAQSIWHLLSECNQRAVIDGEIVECGSWRWTAGRLADYFNKGSYMDYYCGGAGRWADELEKRFKKLGVTLIPIPD